MPIALRCAVILLFLSGEIYAQIPSAATPSSISIRPSYALVTGKPFSASRLIQVTKIAQDGSRLPVGAARELLFRDSEGRLRMEASSLPDPSKPDLASAVEPVSITIVDVTKKLSYSVDVRKRTARRRTIDIFPPVPPLPDNLLDNRDPNFIMEGLGTRIIQGITVTGLRTTARISPGATYPGGEIIYENWGSPEMPKSLLKTIVNSQTDEETKEELIEIRFEMQDPGLFQLPQDYELVDEPQP